MDDCIAMKHMVEDETNKDSNEFTIREHFVRHALEVSKKYTHEKFNIIVVAGHEHETLTLMKGRYMGDLKPIQVEYAKDKNCLYEIFLFKGGPQTPDPPATDQPVADPPADPTTLDPNAEGEKPDGAQTGQGEGAGAADGEGDDNAVQGEDGDARADPDAEPTANDNGNDGGDRGAAADPDPEPTADDNADKVKDGDAAADPDAEPTTEDSADKGGDNDANGAGDAQEGDMGKMTSLPTTGRLQMKFLRRTPQQTM
ncbi:hypothetical protein MMC13_001585 [Lambiella insularis]|nr:hypothetical protein [Lambiella insularis]